MCYTALSLSQSKPFRTFETAFTEGVPLESSFPLLDRRYILTGVYDGGTGYTTWTLPIDDADMDRLVLGSAFGGDAGTIFVKGDNLNGGEFSYDSLTKAVTVIGDYSVGTCVLGVAYDMEVTLSPPFALTRQGNLDFTAHRQIRHLDVAYCKSGPFTVEDQWTEGARTPRVCAIRDPQGEANASGVLRARLNGNAEKMKIKIKSSTPFGVNVSGVFFEMDNNSRRDA